MSAFRSLFRSKEPSRLLQGLCAGKRLQCRNYSGLPKGSKKSIVNQPPGPEKTEGFQSWSRLNFAIPTGLLLIVGAGVLIRNNDERRAILKGQGNEHKRYTLKGPTCGGAFTLVDTEGRMITKDNLLGNWVLLYFGYTSSPDVGPEEVKKMSRVIDILEESNHKVKVMPIFITIDPQRDSPSQLRAYLNEFDTKIIGLTGEICTIRQLAREFRVYFKKVEEEGDDYIVETSHNMYLLDPNMEIVNCFGVESKAEQLSEEILMMISGTSQ